MPGKDALPKATPSKANFDKDFENKRKLHAQFREFKRDFVKAARVSPEVKKLVVPLTKLERAITIAAHGIRFVLKSEKKQRA